MARALLAFTAGSIFIVAWIAVAMIASDHVFKLNIAIQLIYFAIAGFVWVFPVRWLMLWAAHQR